MVLGHASSHWWRTATLGGLLCSGIAAALALGGASTWEWRPAATIGDTPLFLRLDTLSALFLLLLSVVAGAGTLYSAAYWKDTKHPRSAATGRIWWNAMILSMVAVLVQSNGLHFLLCWELFAISAYMLVTLDRAAPRVRRAGWLYLAASHAGTLLLFAFFSTLAARTGSWILTPMRDQTHLAPLFWLALAGFGVKAGLFPLHFWLPSAHANAPSHVSALMSGLAIKMGIYGIVRFSSWLPLPWGAGWAVTALGCLSAVLGVAFALGQHDLKRLLAYHSVENIGIILTGLGLAMVSLEHGTPQWGVLALCGGLLHVWNHGLFKALLFLGAGSVLQATGTRKMSLLGGLWRRMPWTTLFFTLGAMAICGLPPLNGFIGEWLIFRGIFSASLQAPLAPCALPAAMFLAATGALALACFIKVCGIVFLGAPRTPCAQSARECAPAMRLAMALLGAGCVLTGLAPALLWPLITRIAREWFLHSCPLPPAAPLSALTTAHLLLTGMALIGILMVLRLRARTRRSLTWDCGYAEPSARMQYTAGSFASILTAWFAWILRPDIRSAPPEDMQPTSASRYSHTPETVLELLLMPLARTVSRLADWGRTFQHGRVQSYLSYLCLAVFALLAAVTAGL